MFFEIKYAIAQDAELRQHVADFVGDGAQIFADDHIFRANALQGENAHQVGSVIAHISALRGFHAAPESRTAETGA